MGLLDPKLDKGRTFELLRKRNVVKAVLTFQGGHDEGNVENITLITESGAEVNLDVWYCGGYRHGMYGWEPTSTPANEDEELSDLLQGPVNEQFGSWGSVESTSGILTWDVVEGTCLMDYEQDTPKSYSREF